MTPALKETKKLFYGKWLYKISMNIPGCGVLRTKSGDDLMYFLSEVPFNFPANQYPQSIQARALRSKNTLMKLSMLLTAYSKKDYTQRIESDFLDIYTNKKNLIDEIERDFQSFVMADIPGIIEGAAEGKGLGHYFLRHIERNSILLFLIPADADDIKNQYDILLDELRRYNPEMLDKERLVAISKSDLLDEELKTELKQILDNELAVDYIFISSVAQKGIVELKDLLWKQLNT